MRWPQRFPVPEKMFACSYFGSDFRDVSCWHKPGWSLSVLPAESIGGWVRLPRVWDEVRPFNVGLCAVALPQETAANIMSVPSGRIACLQARETRAVGVALPAQVHGRTRMDVQRRLGYAVRSRSVLLVRGVSRGRQSHQDLSRGQ